jgi:HSP20 family protein
MGGKGPSVRSCPVRSRIHAVVLPSETGDFTEEIRRIFRELGRGMASDALAGECSPPVDVLETDGTFEITVDLPGVDPGAVRVAVKGDIVLVAGEKIPRRGRGDSSFHLVERGFGRFARTVRLTKPCDAGKARLTFKDGELRLILPKISERRGRLVEIKIEAS